MTKSTASFNCGVSCESQAPSVSGEARLVLQYPSNADPSLRAVDCLGVHRVLRASKPSSRHAVRQDKALDPNQCEQSRKQQEGCC